MELRNPPRAAVFSLPRPGEHLSVPSFQIDSPRVAWKDSVVLYGGPGQKSPEFRATDAEVPLNHRIKIAHARWDPL